MYAEHCYHPITINLSGRGYDVHDIIFYLLPLLHEKCFGNVSESDLGAHSDMQLTCKIAIRLYVLKAHNFLQLLQIHTVQCHLLPESFKGILTSLSLLCWWHPNLHVYWNYCLSAFKMWTCNTFSSCSIRWHFPRRPLVSHTKMLKVSFWVIMWRPRIDLYVGLVVMTISAVIIVQLQGQGTRISWNLPGTLMGANQPRQ